MEQLFSDSRIYSKLDKEQSTFKSPHRWQSLLWFQEEKFTSYLAGYPGSCHNRYVFSNMQISQHPEKFFDQNQTLPYISKKESMKLVTANQ
ncbi:uncharacterized protein VP01_260g8 [Puccinia sorghi]|uniref:Uncharacterized protein n=1 Tax=Puccinia sorghi TaxID=27349 RepID=A0A0L6V4I0_9BASI|nr:uncharacterized protein VP01_260g8 [Puccinia sorghi]